MTSHDGWFCSSTRSDKKRFCHFLSDLMKRCDHPDVVFRSKDGYTFALHSPMLKLRWPLYENSRSEAIKRIEMLSKKEITPVLEHIYSGSPVPESVRDALDSLGIAFPTGDIFTAYHNDMKKLLTSHEGSNFVIECSGVKFPVHRFILAIRSEFFAGMFESKLAESKTGVLRDEVAGSPDRMRCFLEYIYTGDCQFSNYEDLFHLMSLCHHYDVIECFPGELEEFVASRILQSFSAKMTDAITTAKARGYRKLVDILESCVIGV